MALREELVASGNWLFRWRSYLPLALIGLFVLALQNFRFPAGSEMLDLVWEIACLAVSLFGLGIRVHTVGHAPKGTSGRNTRTQKAALLNTTGLYSVVRNPLYLGNFFMWLGIALFGRSWSVTVVYALSFWLYYERIILAEEEYLRVKFGQDYLDWAARTPAFLPKFANYRRPTLTFSVRCALRREYNGFLALFAVMFLQEATGDLCYLGKLDVDPFWMWALAFSFATWLLLRSLKKHTRLLDVDGR